MTLKDPRTRLCWNISWERLELLRNILCLTIATSMIHQIRSSTRWTLDGWVSFTSMRAILNAEIWNRFLNGHRNIFRFWEQIHEIIRWPFIQRTRSPNLHFFHLREKTHRDLSVYSICEFTFESTWLSFLCEYKKVMKKPDNSPLSPSSSYSCLTVRSRLLCPYIPYNLWFALMIKVPEALVQLALKLVHSDCSKWNKFIWENQTELYFS